MGRESSKQLKSRGDRKHVVGLGDEKQWRRGAWAAQSVKHLTLDFSSGCDLTVCEFEPLVELCAGSMEPAWDFLSVPLSLPSPAVFLYQT